MIRIVLVYGRAGESDGVRRLVDRLWLRGLRKHAAHLDRWASRRGHRSARLPRPPSASAADPYMPDGFVADLLNASG